MAYERDYNNVKTEPLNRIVNRPNKENRDQMSQDEQKLKKLLREVKKWTPGRPTNHAIPRIAVFGKYGSGKSSLLNSLSWVMKFENEEFPGEFIQEVPSSRVRGTVGGGNTNRLLVHNVGGIMEFVDTKGFPAGPVGNCRPTNEIKRICGGYGDYKTDISWDGMYTNSFFDYFMLPGRRMDFAILVVSGTNVISYECREAIKAIKAGTGCAPMIVVTSKSEVQGKETEIHSHLTGLGASRALFVDNYLIDDQGEGPTEDDVDIEKHTALCKVLRTIQRDYDHHLAALHAKEISIDYNRVKKYTICLIIMCTVLLLLLYTVYAVISPSPINS